MASPPLQLPGFRFVPVPRHPDLVALHQLWLARRGARLMPSRADFEPADFRALMPSMQLTDVGAAPGSYTVRLIGDVLVELAGRNNTGKPVGFGQPAESVRAQTDALDHVVQTRGPLFGLGRVYWFKGKSYKTVEAMMLPLSADGDRVTMVIDALKFDVPLPDGW